MEQDGSRVALVTGAGRGLGAGIAYALAGQGYAVVVNDLPTSAGAPEVVARIRADFEAHLAMFVRSPMLISQAIVPGMRRTGRCRRGGHVPVLRRRLVRHRAAHHRQRRSHHDVSWALPGRTSS